MVLKNILKRIFKEETSPEPLCPKGEVSYSLEGEDRVLITFLGDCEPGFYVDVGAHHPFRYSNTALFYQKGWRGVNIDAAPDSMGAFDEHRPEDLNLQIAIAEESGIRNYYIYNEPALNGIDNDRRTEFGANLDCPYFLESIIEVEAAPLKQILVDKGLDFSRPNFLNIDVEGLELEVLNSNDWINFPFQFIVVEQRFADLADVLESDCCSFLRKLGYRPVAHTGRTSFFRRS